MKKRGLAYFLHVFYVSKTGKLQVFHTINSQGVENCLNVVFLAKFTQNKCWKKLEINASKNVKGKI